MRLIENFLNEEADSLLYVKVKGFGSAPRVRIPQEWKIPGSYSGRHFCPEDS
jgi:hypothetical protein